MPHFLRLKLKTKQIILLCVKWVIRPLVAPFLGLKLVGSIEYWSGWFYLVDFISLPFKRKKNLQYHKCSIFLVTVDNFALFLVRSQPLHQVIPPSKQIRKKKRAKRKESSEGNQIGYRWREGWVSWGDGPQGRASSSAGCGGRPDSPSSRSSSRRTPSRTQETSTDPRTGPHPTSEPDQVAIKQLEIGKKGARIDRRNPRIREQGGITGVSKEMQHSCL